MRFLGAGVIVAAALAGSAVPARAQSPSGEAVYKQNCAACHEGSLPRMPTRAALRELTPEHVETALSSFSMRRQGATLSPAERRAVAEFVTGRPSGSYRAPLEVIPKSAYCAAGVSGAPTPLAGASWNGWGTDARNSRYQSAAGAGLTAADVPKLKLKWAFGVPGVSASGSQVSVVGSRVFVPSRLAVASPREVKGKREVERRHPVRLGDARDAGEEHERQGRYGDRPKEPRRSVVVPPSMEVARDREGSEKERGGDVKELSPDERTDVAERQARVPLRVDEPVLEHGEAARDLVRDDGGRDEERDGKSGPGCERASMWACVARCPGPREAGKEQHGTWHDPAAEDSIELGHAAGPRLGGRCRHLCDRHRFVSPRSPADQRRCPATNGASGV